MQFRYDDGGRSESGFKGKAGDCVARAIAIASGRPYAEVYARLAEGMGAQRTTKRRPQKRAASARNGVSVTRKWFKDYMAELGFRWVPTMTIGSGCQVHLDPAELPTGRLVVSVSKHYTAVVNGVIHDTFDPTDRPTSIYPPSWPEPIPKGARWLENGNGWAYSPKRCVYGYWTKAE